MIEITSDYGCIGEFRWMNTNQEFHFEISDSRIDTLPTTMPAWWGIAWFGDVPSSFSRWIDRVVDLLVNDEPRR